MTLYFHFSVVFSGPLSQIKSSLLGSTSDSNLNKYSTINKIPLITLNFTEANNEKKCPSPPSSEKTIIAPKVKDRTHNVTDKVTQVRISPAGLGKPCCYSVRRTKPLEFYSITVSITSTTLCID